MKEKLYVVFQNRTTQQIRWTFSNIYHNFDNVDKLFETDDHFIAIALSTKTIDINRAMKIDCGTNHFTTNEAYALNIITNGNFFNNRRRFKNSIS